MIHRSVTYEDYSDPPKLVTENFWFHLSKFEIMELEASHKGGLQAAIQKMVDAGDNKAVVDEFKKVVLLSYGIRSEDGKSFAKSEELRNQFAQTAAFHTLAWDIATDSNKLADFINSIVPKEIATLMAQQSNNGQGSLPPPKEG